MILSFPIFLFFIGCSKSFNLYDFEEEQLLPKPPDCGTIQHLTKRLYGGSPINVANVPWVVGLEIPRPGDTDDDDNQTSVICGGSLINSRYVLTAAHCIEDENPVSVILGKTNAGDTGIRIDIESSIAHADYQSYEENVLFKGENDIALIRLSNEVEFSRHIQPICLPFSVENYELPSKETNFNLAGWGTRRFSFVEIPFFPFDECEQIYEYYERDLTHNSLCAGGVPGENFCSKDGGGPLMRNLNDLWILDGIITKTTDDACATKTPGVFTNVLKYEIWIKEHIIYGRESNEKKVEKISNKSWDNFGKAVRDWKFWVLVIIVLSILISCCFMVSKFWKTHSTCITFFSIISFIIITALYILSYFV